MADHEVEDLQLRLEAEICGLDKDDLVQMAEHLKVGTEGLRKFALSKKVRKEIEQKVEEADDKQALLKELLKMSVGDPPPLEGEIPMSGADIPIVEKGDPKKPPESGIQNVESGEPKKPPPEAGAKVSVDVSKIFRREFKIHGVIGTDSYKDGLSFVSLIRQIESGSKAGYKEIEIVEAVIRAVSPSLKLRSYLEMITDLSLSKLPQILRAHFKQKSGTELYQELSVLSQRSKETTQ